ncbi:MAG TPA: LysE family translocator [Thermoanaerobaculia bacterium]|nr:LysE family translocator [Thermoanaerobaculia bacterium]
MTFTTWLLFVLMEIPLCLMPGPAVLFVFAHGLRYGGAKSVWANLGILSGNALYFALSATGLGVLVKASHDAFLVVKWAGAAYLIVLGVRMIFSKSAALGEPSSAAEDVRGPNILGRGIVLQLANPKALVFFTAFLPQFVTPDAPIARQMLILGVTSTILEFFILAGYGYFAGRLSLLTKSARFARRINWASGAMLVTCGAGLALTSE